MTVSDPIKWVMCLDLTIALNDPILSYPGLKGMTHVTTCKNNRRAGVKTRNHYKLLQHG